MRLQRQKLCVDDFEPLTIIGRGAFGEVCSFTKTSYLSVGTLLFIVLVFQLPNILHTCFGCRIKMFVWRENSFTYMIWICFVSLAKWYILAYCQILYIFQLARFFCSLKTKSSWRILLSFENFDVAWLSTFLEADHFHPHMHSHGSGLILT